jgi:L(+)-tartrate dehydratase beta subunit
MSEIILSTPIKDEAIRDLSIGDIIYLDGYLVTGRDGVHQRLLKQRKPLPVDLAEKAVFHAGPIMREIPGETGRYEVISIGPTTSMRMEKYEKEFIAETGVKLIVGKGGMGPKTAEGCREYTALHAIFPGGCAVLAAREVEAVEAVEWLDLGMPEAIWVLRVKRFGPLLISIDTRGNNLFENNKRVFNERKDRGLEKLYKRVDYIE